MIFSLRLPYWVILFIRGSPFVDANKRTAWEAMHAFIEENGYLLTARSEEIVELIFGLRIKASKLSKLQRGSRVIRVKPIAFSNLLGGPVFTFCVLSVLAPVLPEQMATSPICPDAIISSFKGKRAIFLAEKTATLPSVLS